MRLRCTRCPPRSVDVRGLPPPSSMSATVPPRCKDRGMDLPVMPPVKPMLAKSIPEIPTGDLSYQPKYDGFRAIVFKDGDEIEIGSRHTKSMARYFPEMVAAFREGLPERCVLDGEIVIPDAAGVRLDFEALLQRIHP